MDVEAHSRVLHLPDQTQQLGIHAEGSTDFQNGGADGLVGWPRTSIEKRPATEVGCGQRAHRRRAWHVEVLGPGYDVREWRHLIQGRELFRDDRNLILSIDVGSMSLIETRKLFLAHDCLL